MKIDPARQIWAAKAWAEVAEAEERLRLILAGDPVTCETLAREILAKGGNGDALGVYGLSIDTVEGLADAVVAIARCRASWSREYAERWYPGGVPAPDPEWSGGRASGYCADPRWAD